MDQGLAVAKAVVSGTGTGISGESFKQYRGTVAGIIEANNDINSRIYDVHNTPGNKTDQYPYLSELGDRYINDLTNYPMCNMMPWH